MPFEGRFDVVELLVEPVEAGKRGAGPRARRDPARVPIGGFSRAGVLRFEAPQFVQVWVELRLQAVDLPLQAMELRLELRELVLARGQGGEDGEEFKGQRERRSPSARSVSERAAPRRDFSSAASASPKAAARQSQA